MSGMKGDSILEKNLSAQEKLSRIPIKVATTTQFARKPTWLKQNLPRVGEDKVNSIKSVLRKGQLTSVCEEASCPNLSECFSKGTATFMIMGHKCTRRCAFCDVAHGRPDALDTDEPSSLARTIANMQLRYVVITSVDRDDLRDGGAEHFVACMNEIRKASPTIKIEILVPDFRNRLDKALNILAASPPDCFNHNIETIPRLYKKARLGADYQHSLTLLKQFKTQHPNIPTKSGLMVGLGETDEELEQVFYDLRRHQVNRLTIGQYLQPTRHHLPVERYVSPEGFTKYAEWAKKMGFEHVASGARVRSSYHADVQFEQDLLG